MKNLKLIIAILMMLAAAVMVLMIAGCQAGPAFNSGKPSAPELSRQTQASVAQASALNEQAIAHTQKGLVDLKAYLDAPSAATAHFVSDAYAELNASVAADVAEREPLAAAGVAATQAEKASTNDAKTITAQATEITKLKASNPVVKWFYAIGAGLIAAGIAIFILYEFTGMIGATLLGMRPAALALSLAAAGFVFVFVARYLDALIWISAIGLGVVVAGYFLLHWLESRQQPLPPPAPKPSG